MAAQLLSLSLGWIQPHVAMPVYGRLTKSLTPLGHIFIKTHIGFPLRGDSAPNTVRQTLNRSLRIAYEILRVGRTRFSSQTRGRSWHGCNVSPPLQCSRFCSRLRGYILYNINALKKPNETGSPWSIHHFYGCEIKMCFCHLVHQRKKVC